MCECTDYEAVIAQETQYNIKVAKKPQGYFNFL